MDIRKWVIVGYVVLMLTLLFIFLDSIKSSLADTPTSLPRSVSEVDFEVSGTNIAALWIQDDGSVFCGAVQASDLVSISWKIPDKQDGESIGEFFNRASPVLFTRELSESEKALCQILLNRSRPIWFGNWIVDQWRDSPTRPVYEITPQFPSVKNKIGTIAHSTQCGDKVADYSTTITAYEWRRVTLLPDNIEGASVCRKQ